MFLDNLLKYATLTISGASSTNTVDVGQDNVGDGVAVPEIIMVANTVPAAGSPDTTAYAIDLVFTSDSAGSSVVETIPLAKGVLRSALTAGKLVVGPKPVLRFPARYAKITVTPSGTSISGAKFDFAWTVNGYKPDANV